MKSELIGILSPLAVFSMLLSACGPRLQETVPAVSPENATEEEPPTITLTEPPLVEPKVLYGNFPTASDIPTIDPVFADSTGPIQVIDETTIGLTHVNNGTGASEPGMATYWEARVDPDGTQTLTFHLRDDVPWVRWNGEAVEAVKTCDGSADRMVTAWDFVYGIRRYLDPATAAYPYLLGYMLKGAANFNSGATSDFASVGVKALDKTTLEMTFLTPAVYNVQIAGLWFVRAQPKWVIEGDCDGAVQARRDRWTEPGFFQSYGPFTLKEWVHDYAITLVKNPYWPGTESVPQPRIDEVNLRMLEASVAFTEYVAGNLDYTQVPPENLDPVRADPVLSKELKIEPVRCTDAYRFNTKAPVVDDVRVRRALSLAVDRQSLVDHVTKGGEIPAQWFALPGGAGVPSLADHPGLGVKYDPEKARAELQSYLDEKKITADKLDLTLRYMVAGAASPGSSPINEAVQQMWRSTLGVDVKLDPQEWKTFLQTIGGKDTPQIYNLGWCQDYPDANNWDRDVFAAGGDANPADMNGNTIGGVNWRNDEFERLVLQAVVETDPDKRVEMYARAEQILVWEDAVVIPIIWATRSNITKPYVARTYGAGDEAFETWDLKPH